jgi:hypothetical protein
VINPATYSFPYGKTVVTWELTDEVGNTETTTQDVIVQSVKTITTVTVTPVAPKVIGEQQYSDLVTFKATVSPANCGTTAVGGSVTFKVGTQVMGTATIDQTGNAVLSNIALLEGVVGQMASSTTAKIVTAEFTGFNAAYVVTNKSTSLTITQEDARVNFTGTQLVATQSATSSVATVTLRATVQDISATSDAAGDLSSGDIRNSKVRFLNGTTPIVISGVTDINGWLSPTLVNSSDLTTGIVSANWPVNIGNATDVEYTVGIEVAGYYIRNKQDDNTVITVYKPVGDFITGGGHIIPTKSAGQYASDAGLKTNFGFNVKYNKSGTNLQGNMNIIFRRTVNGVIRVYQIKSNAMSSLGVNIANPSAQTAVFVAKANLTDITNPLAPISLGGGLSFQVNMTDKGEPGSSDLIAMSLYDGSTLLYSSNWVSNNTSEMLLAGGNLVVRSGFSLGTATTTAAPITSIGGVQGNKLEEVKATRFDVIAFPNPSKAQFNVKVTSDNNRDKIELRVVNANGRIVRIIPSVQPGQTILLGNEYRPGVYFLEMIQGNNRKMVRLMKLPD